MSSASPAAYSDPASGMPLSPVRRRSRTRHASLSTGQSVYDWLVLILVALAPWLGVWLFGAVRWWSIGPLMGLIFLATVLCALRYGFERDGLTRRFPPGFMALAVFVFYAFLLIPRAAVPYDAHMECLKLASLWCAYGVWSELSGWQGRWRWLVAAFLLVVTVMAWYAIIQHMQGSRDVLNLIRPKDYAMRASGAYFCPNHFANLLDMTVPFALAIAASPAAGLPLRLLAGYSVLVALPPLYLTQSRSGWIGMLLGSVTVIALLGLRRSVRRFLLLLLVGTGGARRRRRPGVDVVAHGPGAHRPGPAGQYSDSALAGHLAHDPGPLLAGLGGPELPLGLSALLDSHEQFPGPGICPQRLHTGLG
jgi:hypothetical protein